MSDLPQILRIADAIVLPSIAIILLLISKIGRGELARWSEGQFYVALVVMTLVTLRTVVMQDGAWLVHTAALGITITIALTTNPVRKPANLYLQHDPI